MEDTSVNFTIPTKDLSLFSKKLYPLAKTDRTSILTFLVNQDNVVIRFKVNLDGSGAEAVFEHVLRDVQVTNVGQISVYSNDFAEVINKYPCFKHETKPHTKELNFSGKPGSLKVKTKIYWNDKAKPSSQQLNINTVKTPEEILITPLDVDKIEDNTVELDNVALLEAIDMCSFIRGDVTSKDDQGYWFITEGDRLSILATDLMVASRQTLTIFNGQAKMDGILSRQILQAVKAFISGDDPVIFKTFKRLVYVKSGNSRMVGPMMKTVFPLDSSIFFTDSYALAEVEIAPLSHVLSHFLVIDTHPYHRTTLEFNASSKSFKLSSGQDGINCIDNLPSKVVGSGKFDVDASYFYTVLFRMKKAGEVCTLYLDKETSEKITIISGDGEVRYLIQGLTPEHDT